jgi:hypothetical protein
MDIGEIRKLHTCKKWGENSCDGYVLDSNLPVSGRHMQEIQQKLVGV